MTEADILPRLREFVTENFLYMRRDTTIGDDDSLLARGVIDSLGVMELVGFVEGAFGIKVDPADITEEHFGSLAAMARYVAGRGARA